MADIDVDSVARKLGYRCVPISWEDPQQNGDDKPSDVRLYEKSGTLLYTLRAENWDERVGYVAAKDVTVMAGTSIALDDYLRNLTSLTPLPDLDSGTDMYDPTTDKRMSIRFQCVFLPVRDREPTEFCTEVYNYNTTDPKCPRNMFLLCSPQCTTPYQSTDTRQRLYLVAKDGSGTPTEYYMRAEHTNHRVGAEQRETAAEAEAARREGRATAVPFGTKAMGSRFNAVMLVKAVVQICVKTHTGQTIPLIVNGWYTILEIKIMIQENGGIQCGKYQLLYNNKVLGNSESVCKCGIKSGATLHSRPKQKRSGKTMPIVIQSLTGKKTKMDVLLDATVKDIKTEIEDEEGIPCDKQRLIFAGKELADDCPLSYYNIQKDATLHLVLRHRGGAGYPFCVEDPVSSAVTPTTNAARVSYGSRVGEYGGLANKEPRRDPTQHGTITVTMYYTVAGGVPSAADVEACVKELNALYAACRENKKLSEAKEITSTWWDS